MQVLLAKVSQEKNKLSSDGGKALEEAEAIANGLDPYLEKVSTPHPDILVSVKASMGAIHGASDCSASGPQAMLVSRVTHSAAPVLTSFRNVMVFLPLSCDMIPQNDMLKKTNETDWKALYEQKKTQIPLIKEMSAGGYEAVVLREFATMTKVSLLAHGVRRAFGWGRLSRRTDEFSPPITRRPNVSSRLASSRRRRPSLSHSSRP